MIYDIKNLIFCDKIYETVDTYIYNGIYFNVECIIKVILNDVNYGIKHKAMREICALKKFHHANIMKLYDVFFISNIEKNTVVIVCEKGICDLDNVQIKKLNKYNTIKNISEGLKYIHSKHYTHCDLSSSNVALFKNGVVKIIDFGSCTKIYRQSAITLPTPHITPIEMLKMMKINNLQKIDSWALGCMVYYIITGNKLIKKDNYVDIHKEIIEKIQINIKNVSIKKELEQYIDPITVKQTSKLININMNKRLSVENFYNNLYENISVISTLQKHICNFEETSSYILNHVNKKLRRKIFDNLIKLNTDNTLPIENLFLTFNLSDNCNKKNRNKKYVINTVIIHSLTTKLICNSSVPLVGIIKIIENILNVRNSNISVCKLNEYVSDVFTTYNYNFDIDTLFSFLPDIEKRDHKKFIIIAFYMVYDINFNNLSLSYKKNIIIKIINMIEIVKNNQKYYKIKLCNFYRDMNEIKKIIKAILKYIDIDVVVKYFKSINLFDDYVIIKYFFSDYKFNMCDIFE